MVQVPALEIVTLLDARTPLVNVGVVPPPAVKFPVEVISTVLPAPVKPVAILLLISKAVTFIVNGVLVIWVPIFPPADASTMKWSTGPPVNVTVVVFEAVTASIEKPIVAFPATIPLVSVAV